MKKGWKIGFLIGLVGTLLIWGFMIFVVVILLDSNWWWFFGSLIFFIFAWVMVGIIYLVSIWGKKKPQILQIDLNESKARAIHDMKNDINNPDNFVIQKSKLFKVGQPGRPRTPIDILMGYGTETLQRRTAIVNKVNPEKETTFLVDPSEEEIEKCANMIADNPPTEETIEEIQGEFGLPGRRIQRRPFSIIEQQKAIEDKKAEEEGAM